jgi:hypothetical protein
MRCQKERIATTYPHLKYRDRSEEYNESDYSDRMEKPSADHD